MNKHLVIQAYKQLEEVAFASDPSSVHVQAYRAIWVTVQRFPENKVSDEMVKLIVAEMKAARLHHPEIKGQTKAKRKAMAEGQRANCPICQAHEHKAHIFTSFLLDQQLRVNTLSLVSTLVDAFFEAAPKKAL